MKNRVFLCILFVLMGALTSSAFADTYIFKKYKFNWTVFANNQIVYQIVKEPGSTQVELHTPGLVQVSLFMTPKQASQVSNILSRTSKYYENFNLVNREVVEKYSSHNGFIITFEKRKDTLSKDNKLIKGKFTVTISNDNPYKATSITVDKDTAKALSKLLFQAPYRVAFVNKKLYALNVNNEE